MKNKELEEQLKSSAEKIELKDFSTRWESIKDRLETEAETADTVVSVESVALATNNGTTKNKVKKISVCVLVGFIIIGVVLAIVLPLVLKSTIKYFDEGDLFGRYVTETDFYSNSEISELSSLEFPFEKDSFEILIAQDGSIKGGGFDFFDENTITEGKIYFYDKSIIFKKNHIDFKNKVIIDSAEVYYNEIENTNNYKRYEAIIEMNYANYKLDIIFYSENNFIQFIENYFN